VPAFVRKGGKVETVTLGDVLDHVDHAVGLLGVEHVGIGSDFDGGGGVTGWRNAGESAAVTAGLLARGYDAAAIGLLWGGNFLRVLRQAEAAAG
jgi:membrane dipeptidase